MLKTAQMTAKTAILTVLAVVSSGAVCAAQDAAGPLQWSLVGGKPFEAEFVRTTENGVVLRQPSSGRETEVPFSKLDIKSHFQAKKLASPESYNKPLVKAEVKPEGPKIELARALPEDLESPFPADPSIEQFLSTVKRELEAGNIGVVWHAMPSRMRDDIDTLAEKAGEKLGPTRVGQIRKVMESVGIIVQEKSEYLFANPMINSQPGVAQMVKPIWPEISGLVGAMTLKEHWRADNYKKGNLFPSLVTFTKTIKPFADALEPKVKPLLPPQANAPQTFEYKILSQSKDRAEVEIDAFGQPKQKVALQKVGNIWIIPSMMNDMRKGIDEGTKAIDNLQSSDLSMFSFGLTGVNAIVGKLAAAESQQEFDDSVQQLVTMVQDFMPSPPGQ